MNDESCEDNWCDFGANDGAGDVKEPAFCNCEDFWLTYCTENEENVLSQWVVIGARDFNVSARTLNKLSRTCKYFFSAVQWRLTRCKLLREKWSPVIAPKLYRHLLMKSHPIKYTGYAAKTIPVNEELGVGPFGVRLLDTLRPLFSEEDLASTKYAFSNVTFRARKCAPFVMIVFVANNAIMSVEVNRTDYIDTGENTPEVLAKYREEYGDNPSAYPGRYIVNLHLPTKYNPITLGKPLVQPNRIHFCIAENYSLSYYDGEQVADIIFNVDFTLETFTHAIVHFKTVSPVEYNWSEYGMTFNGKINSHVNSTSLIRRIDSIKKENERTDERTDERTENTEVLMNGFYIGAPTVTREGLATMFRALGIQYVDSLSTDNPTSNEINEPVEYYTGSDSEDGNDGGFYPWYQY